MACEGSVYSFTGTADAVGKECRITRCEVVAVCAEVKGAVIRADITRTGQLRGIVIRCEAARTGADDAVVRVDGGGIFLQQMCQSMCLCRQ